MSLDGYNMFVAKKGGELYIWCAFELTGAQRIQLINHLKEVAPSELTPVKEDKTTTTTTGAGCGFSISNNSVTFDNPSAWAMVYLNNISFNVTNAKIINTYKENVPTTGNLTITKVLSGVTADKDMTFTFDVMQGEDVKRTVSVKVEKDATSGSIVVENLPVGSYTVVEKTPVEAPAGYTLSETVYDYGENADGSDADSATVTENGATVTVTNTYEKIIGTPVNNTATLTITKVDADNEEELLPGAVFTLTKYDDDNNVIKELKSTYDAEKKLYTITGIDVEGDWTLTETQAPKGYQQTSQTWTIAVIKESSENLTDGKYVTTNTYKISAVGEDALTSAVQKLAMKIKNTKIPDTVERIPVTKNVTISRGSKVPVAIPFTFKAYVGDQEVGELKLTPTKDSDWTATGMLQVSIPYDLFEDGVATVTIKEVNDKAANWTYDDSVKEVNVYQFILLATADQEQEPTTLTFTNTYSYKYTPTPRPTTPTTVTSVKTGDMGVALYAGLAILSMTGSAGVILRRRKNDK